MSKKVTERNFIIIGQQPWDTEIGSNCKNVALELSKNHRVLYVNSPLDRVTLMRAKNDPKVIKRHNVIKGKEDGLVKIQDNLWNYYPDCIVESINFLKSHSLFNFFNKRNNKKFARSINKALNKLGFTDPILFNDNEMFKGFYLQDFLKPHLGIYYSRDYMLGVDYWKRHGLQLEPQLIAKSNLCFSNSEYLAEYCRKYNQNSYYIGQGCDVDDFINVSSDVPEDVQSVNKPIIGYVGALNSERLDLDIIELIATTYPQYSVVLVGPEDDKFKASKLHQLTNVAFLGQKPVSMLPNYIAAFDICINPQLVNEITIGNYPRKIDEYLALGKPTIATATKTMETFRDFVYLADSPQDYIKLIAKALEENSEALKTKRTEFALTHTWEQSVKLMMDQIVKYESEHNG
ncbi:glycosyltransferase family 1 protein [Mucilaginibacter corticis]|uniref:Glycosyltransferase family 1 protein n=1 Tax=Mucilaginibacter corticis TaxID=2597670 RepID=A0A556MLD7_9SPHI|nr:glycosyltransferase [Mucilaginibacter corticis]TSJ40746.1 glycosyltransferase family 1 protein [Mucilaginibacter corticis]